MAALDEEADAPVRERVAKLYREVYEASDSGVQKKATGEYVRVLREDGELVVMTYEAAFFRGADLKNVAKADATLVKDHLLERLRKSRSKSLMQAAAGISRYLTADEQMKLIDAVV